jgi:hypothetical protein
MFIANESTPKDLAPLGKRFDHVFYGSFRGGRCPPLNVSDLGEDQEFSVATKLNQPEVRLARNAAATERGGAGDRNESVGSAFCGRFGEVG